MRKTIILAALTAGLALTAVVTDLVRAYADVASPAVTQSITTWQAH